MRTIFSALAGLALLSAPAIASAHPRFEREVVERPVVVAPAAAPFYRGATPIYREPAYVSRPRIVVNPGHRFWHGRQPRAFRGNGCR